MSTQPLQRNIHVENSCGTELWNPPRFFIDSIFNSNGNTSAVTSKFGNWLLLAHPTKVKVILYIENK